MHFIPASGAPAPPTEAVPVEGPVRAALRLVDPAQGIPRAAKEPPATDQAPAPALPAATETRGGDRCMTRSLGLSTMKGVDDHAGGDFHKQVVNIGLPDPTLTTAGIAQLVVCVIVHPIASVHLCPGDTLATLPRLLLPAWRWRVALVRSTGMRGRAIAARVVRRIGPGRRKDEHGHRGQCNPD